MNGHNAGWRFYVRLWPILAGILAVSFYLGGRLETPTEKQQRIERAIRGKADKTDVEQHKSAAVPHPVLSVQIKAIAEDVKWIREQMERNP